MLPAIDWEPASTNLVMTELDDRTGVSFRRTKYGGHDVALGQAIVSGYHTWTVKTPNTNANAFVGVAAADCDKFTYPAGTTAWTVCIHDGTLCSGVAQRDWNKAAPHSMYGLSAAGKGSKSSAWLRHHRGPFPRGTAVDVILDMQAHTLSFAIGDADPQLAYTDLPSVVYPYVCSGEVDDRSLMIVTD